MAIESTHPFFDAMLKKWTRARDCYEGEDAIKSKRDTYLKPTAGMIKYGFGKNNMHGEEEYIAMLERAVFPDIYKEAVEAAIGIMHRKPAEIILPAILEPMIEKSTSLGESLQMLLRKINAEQLTTGRLGLLGDIKIDRDRKEAPVIAVYGEGAIRNWADSTDNAEHGLNIGLVVLDESRYVMGSSFEWEEKTEYRVLALSLQEGGSVDFEFKGNYGTAVAPQGTELGAIVLTSPSLKGMKLDKIPFTFINSKDLSPCPDRPPLDGLASACLAIYRAEADYRQSLFMQGQDTLVVRGQTLDPNEEDKPIRVGAGAKIMVPADGDAKFIGVSSKGLSEQRTALENDYSRAIQKSGQLLDATSRAKESGDALRIRVAAQTATLPQIAKTGAAGLEKVLRNLAEWFGANPDDVKVIPNLEFSEADLNGETILKAIQAKILGAPISEESLHGLAKSQGFTTMEYEDEATLLASEEPRMETGNETVNVTEEEDEDDD